VGQTFNRFTAEQTQGREPHLHLLRSIAPPDAHWIELRLHGDSEHGTNRSAVGAIVRVRVGAVTMQRQVIGVGGHNGKAQDLLIHFGLGFASRADEITIIWPDAAGSEQHLAGVDEGRYELKQGGVLEPMR